jgi:hypothetical protein
MNEDLSGKHEYARDGDDVSGIRAASQGDGERHLLRVVGRSRRNRYRLATYKYNNTAIKASHR